MAEKIKINDILNDKEIFEFVDKINFPNFNKIEKFLKNSLKNLILEEKMLKIEEQMEEIQENIEVVEVNL